MKLVFICLDPFPYSGACASIIKKLIDSGLKDKEWSISVVCASTNRHQINDGKNYGDIQIVRFCNWNAVSLQEMKNIFFASPLLGLKGLTNKIADRFIKRKSSDFVLHENIVAQIHKCLKDINCCEGDILIPVAGLYETVEAALSWKKMHGGNVIVYQVDPCSTNFAYSIDSYQSRLSFERKVYHEANRVITTPLIYREIETQIVTEDLNKAQVMEFPNLVLNDVHDELECYSNENTVNCVFSGMVYKGIRDPAFAIKLFGALGSEKINFILVGVSENQAKQYVSADDIKSNMIFYDYMSAEAAMRFVNEADFLVNIGNTALNQVPSKLFSYIATGKPIINICVSHSCPTIKYLDKYPLALNIYQTDDIQPQLKELVAFIENSKGKRVPSTTIKENFYKCSAEYCAGIFKDACADLKKEEIIS